MTVESEYVGDFLRVRFTDESKYREAARPISLKSFVYVDSKSFALFWLALYKII